jgi:protein phosphatase
MIPLDDSKIRYSSQSHAGLAGKENQDRFALKAFLLKEGSRSESVVGIVADGLDGHRAGDSAAKLAVDVIYEAIASSQGSQPNGILEAALLLAGQSILAQSEAEKAKRGMGSTALCAWVIDKRLYSAAVGDSRLYLLRGERLQLLNSPDEILEAGKGAKDEETEDSGSVYLGSRLHVDVELSHAVAGKGNQSGFQLQANDRLLLGSKGLFESLGEERMVEILGQARIEDVAGKLVQEALDAGAQDNLTALAIAIPPGRPMPAYRQNALRRRLRLALASFMLILISLLGWYFLAPQIDPSFTPVSTAINTLTPVP